MATDAGATPHCGQVEVRRFASACSCTRKRRGARSLRNRISVRGKATGSDGDEDDSMAVTMPSDVVVVI